MSKITRRGVLGAGGGLIGLAACGTDTETPSITVSPDARPGYPGIVAFNHGVASGDPLSDRVILWTRVTPDEAYPDAAIPVTYGVFTDPEMTQSVAYSEGFALANRDYTVKVDVAGLQPGTVYYFHFIAKTTAGSVASPVGRTKTTAASGDTPLRFAFLSCANWPFGRFHAYRDVANTPDLDAVIHLGDYLYEYGLDGYGGQVGAAIGRNHNPPLEIITLDDYRTRHAQYKSDPDLQAAHAAAPWLCTWDDHESANDAYRTGAQNHNPEENEGNWTDRKQAAVQAYLEWMPIRDPVPSLAREQIYRSFDFGDIATILCLETRLTGRSEEISWFTEVGGVDPLQVPIRAAATMTRVNDPARTMLGAVQEAWLDDQLTGSVKRGKTWQVLANQVIMAKVKPPVFPQTLSEEQVAAQDIGFISQLIEFSVLGLPFNLDAWDGFPAARERLYASAKGAGAKLVTLAGDTHTGWANTLYDAAGEQRGVEFGTTSVTSPGFGTYMKEVPDVGEQFAAANTEVEWHDPFGNGWTLLTLTSTSAHAEYRKVSDVTSPEFTTETVAAYETVQTDGLMTPLKPL